MFVMKTFLLYVIIHITKAEWVEIPFMKSVSRSGTSHVRYKKIILSPSYKNSSQSITIRPNKTSIKEVFGTYGHLTTQNYEKYLLPITSTTSTTTVTPKSTTLESIISKSMTSKTSTVRTTTSKFTTPKIITTTPTVATGSNDDKKQANDIKNTSSSSSGYDLFMSLLRSVQNNLMKNAHNSMSSKLQVLNNLKDNLLMNIDYRMKQLWPMDDDSKKKTREYPEESHVDFPSNEGALITIGFLTLAVFLVKLVLQVIHVIKAKKLYYNGSGTTATLTTLGRRRKRSEEFDTASKILHLIETYQLSP